MKKLKNLGYKYIILLCGLFILHGCATNPIKQVDNTIISDSSDGNSTFYFIDDSSYWLGFMYKSGKGGVTIYINSMLLDQLEQDGFKKVHLKPGSYTLSILPHSAKENPFHKSAYLDLVAEENKTYYIVGSYSGSKEWASPLAGSPFDIKQVTHEIANVLMKRKE